jgi:hypothetical protein
MAGLKSVGWVLVGFALSVLIGGEQSAWGANSCVGCHQQAGTLSALPAWYQDAYVHWYGSVHGKKGVTCDKCHGGDPGKADKKKAHLGILPSSDSKSPIYYKNIPETCGSCHKEVYRAFSQSRHYRNLKADRLAPTCTTCHGFQMDIGPVSRLQMAGRCQFCHNPQKGIKPEIVEQTRRILEKTVQTEQAIEKAQTAVELAGEQGAKAKGAENKLRLARKRLEGTGAFWHRFQLADFDRELSDIESEAREVSDAARRAMTGK